MIPNGYIAYLGITAILTVLTYHHYSIGLITLVSFFHLLYQRIPNKYFLFLIISPFFWYWFITFSYQQYWVKAENEENITSFLRFIDYPTFDGNKMEVIVKTTDGEKWLLTFRLQSESEKIEFQNHFSPGITCLISGNKQLPPEPKNENLFHYRLYLATNKIFYLFTPEKISLSQCVKQKKTILDHLIMIRKNGIEFVNHHFPEEAAPTVNALIFGDKSEMDKQVLADYQKLGLSHLLAISGLHVSILTASIYFVLLRFGCTRERTRTILLIGLPIYMILAGASPSVIRAVVMSWIILFLSKWRGQIFSIDALGISFLIAILDNPFILYHVGFQLSYLVSATLLLSTTILRKYKGWLLQGFIISFLAQLSSIPFILYHFFEFSLLTIFMNIFYVPLYSIIFIPLSLLSIVVLLVLPTIGMIFAKIFSNLLQAANQVAMYFANLDLFTIVLGRPTIVISLCYVISMIIVFYMIEKEMFTKKMLVSLFFPFFVHLLFVKYSPVGEITMIDVGQGDSILIRLPFQQSTYLIDTGGTLTFPVEKWQERESVYDPGKSIVIPYLKSKGIHKINKLILTHGDVDHIGSAISILSELKVDELLIGKTNERKSLEERTIQEAVRRRTKVIEVFEGAKWKKGKYKFFVLSPKAGSGAGNDSSIVIFTRIGGKTWLFTGDLEVKGENRLMISYPQLEVDVLKVGHHGSKTSTSREFLQHFQAKIALISVGEKNRYGHPHQEVIQRLAERKMSIYRTDHHGGITYYFFMEKGFFTTFIKDE